MCTGACILYKVARVVIGENKTFVGGEAYLKQRGVEVVVLESQECMDLMSRFIQEKPHVWYVPRPSRMSVVCFGGFNTDFHFYLGRNEDIGEP